MALRSIELFAGAGGLAPGLESVGVRPVCFVEREAFAAACLVKAMEEGRLAEAPIWSDVVTFDGRPWRGRVEVVAGGFPCQDVSTAGKGAGIKVGTRSGLWFEYARIVAEVAPRYVFIENVGALVRRGLDIVLSDLAALGYDAEWGCFRASDVGSPHRRERVFILAYANGERGQVPVAGGQPAIEGAGGDGSVVGYRDSHGRGGKELLLLKRRQAEASSNSHGASHRNTVQFPPGPDDTAGWVDYLQSNPSLEPAICRGADGLACRVDRVRALGNGVVPQQAALAWRELHRRIG